MSLYFSFHDTEFLRMGFLHDQKTEQKVKNLTVKLNL